MILLMIAPYEENPDYSDRTVVAAAAASTGVIVLAGAGVVWGSVEGQAAIVATQTGRAPNEAFTPVETGLMFVGAPLAGALAVAAVTHRVLRWWRHREAEQGIQKLEAYSNASSEV